MNFENYNKEQKTIDLIKANKVALKYLAFFTVIFALPFFLIWGFTWPTITKKNIIPLAFAPLVVFILGIVLHELIHGVFFAIFATKGINAVKFGVLWKMMTPYCHCSEPLRITQYKIALLAPLVLLGFIPGIISLFTANLYLLVFGIFFSGAAAGDLMIYNLIKNENPEDYVQDHPSEAGYYIFRKK